MIFNGFSKFDNFLSFLFSADFPHQKALLRA